MRIETLETLKTIKTRKGNYDIIVRIKEKKQEGFFDKQYFVFEARHSLSSNHFFTKTITFGLPKTIEDMEAIVNNFIVHF